MRHISLAHIVPTLLLSVASNLTAEDVTQPIPVEPTADNSVEAVTPVTPEPQRMSSDSSQDVIVVTARRQEMNIADVAGTVHLISHEEIKERARPIQLNDWLNTVPGVNTYRSGGVAGASSIRLRGALSSGTQFVYDGVPLKDSSAPQTAPNASMGNTAGIKQVEVALGPQSSLYGSDAVGGLVHVIPLRATEEHEGFIRMGAGSFETTQFDSQMTGPLTEKLGYAFGVSTVKTDGFSNKTTDDDGDPKDHEEDGFTRQGVYARLDWFVTDNIDLSFIADKVDSESEYDGASADDAASISEVDALRYQINADADVTDTLFLSIRLAQTEYDRLYPASTWVSGYKGAEDFASVQVGSDIDEQTSVSGGVEYRKEEITTVPVSAFATPVDEDAIHRAVWAQTAYDRDDYSFDASVRNEQHSTGPNAATWHLGGAYFLNDRSVKIHANVGTAYRAASLSESHYGTTDASNLKAEESMGAELGILAQLESNLTLAATAFQTDYRKRIIIKSDFSAYINDDGGYVRGVELSARQEVTDLDLSWNIAATIQEAEEDKAVEERLPEQVLHLSVTWAPQEGAWLRADVHHVGTRKPSQYAVNQDDLDAYTIIDLVGGWPIGDSLVLDARVENIFDTDYEQIDAYATPGQSVYVGLTATY